jgi:hypothetical protein
MVREARVQRIPRRASSIRRLGYRVQGIGFRAAYRGGPLQSGVSKPRGLRRRWHNVTQVANCVLNPALFEDVGQIPDRHQRHLGVLLLLRCACRRRARGFASGSVWRRSYHAAPLTDMLRHAPGWKLAGRYGPPHRVLALVEAGNLQSSVYQIFSLLVAASRKILSNTRKARRESRRK